MVEKAQVSAEFSDDTEWAQRTTYWQDFAPPKRRGAPRKFRYREPLMLCGHGAGILVDHNTLLIRNGFTHYPQRSEEIRLFPGDANLPDRIIILDASGRISFSALNWMFEQNISLVQLDWRGRVQMVGGSSYSANSKLVEAQRALQKNSKRRVEIARWLIREKISASIRMLSATIPKSEKIDNTILKLENWILEVDKPRKCNSISKIHGIEGGAASIYFQAWNGIPIKWSALKKRPIPDAWRKIGARKMSWRKSGQNARHPLNAMLNYGYAILISQMRTEIISAGLDPSIGIMHGISQNQIPLVYDLIEPLRPAVDRCILEFALSNTFSPSDFVINKFGGCRLNPQLAMEVVKSVQHACVTDPTVRAFLRRTTSSSH